MEITSLSEFKEELFCLNYELNALAGQSLRRESERWVYKFMFPDVEEEHLSRYNFAKKYCEEKRVLDMACGCGYGSFILATQSNSKEVTGVDLDVESIRYGEHRYKHQKIKRFVDDAVKFKANSKFDVIISFETVEHIPTYNEFINNLIDNLEDNGKLIISSPIVNKTTNNCNNPYHVIEWTYNDFVKLLSENFFIEETYFQNITLVTDDIPPKTLSRRLVDKLLKIPHPKKRTPILFERNNNQYDVNAIVSGVQICVCRKK